MSRWVDALGTLVDERIGQPVVVLGHSMGTIIGLEAWARWPERIRAAIFVGGLPRVAPHIRERLSERVRALAGATDLDGWGTRVSPGVFAASTFVDRPEVVAAFERLFELQSVEFLAKDHPTWSLRPAQPFQPVVASSWFAPRDSFVYPGGEREI